MWEKVVYYAGIVKQKTKLFFWIGTTALITVGLPLYFSQKI